VERLSETRDALNEFSSVDCINAKHESLSSEASHEYFHLARYINSVTGKSSSVVVYGLELEQVKFMENLRRKIESLSVRIS
jgi:hypothetical protein